MENFWKFLVKILAKFGELLYFCIRTEMFDLLQCLGELPIAPGHG